MPPLLVVWGGQCDGIPSLAFNSSLHAGWPPELELSTSETPLSAGLGGREPETERNSFFLELLCVLKVYLVNMKEYVFEIRDDV